jgi:predicted PurR-regulated permease PerM
MRPKPRQAGDSTIARIVSFLVLLVIVIIIGVVFFQVMAFFIVPIFLAVVLVIVFRPVNQRILAWCGGRSRVAAGLTTIAILVIVLLPIGLVVSRAAAEGWSLVAQLGPDAFSVKTVEIRHRMHLDLPPPEIREAVAQIGVGLKNIAAFPEPGGPAAEQIDPARAASETQNIVRGLQNWVADPKRWGTQAEPLWLDLGQNSEMRKRVDTALSGLAERLEALQGMQQLHPDFRRALDEADQENLRLRILLLGEPPFDALRSMANPGPDQIKSLRVLAQDKLAPAALQATPSVGKTFFGLMIMIAAVYFFFADGPAMVRTVMRLSPLDEKYEQQLLEEFGKVSRAVVSATLLSALVQGVLAGIGFKVAGVQSVFLLSVLTAVLAMIPFLGAAAVWVPTAVWLYVEGHQAAGIGLAIYGLLIISVSDNVVKPLVLHGQSNLHPLLALLSVLGGVAALGPIGIFVGPMAVVFLQVVLQMLNAEMSALAGRAAPAAEAAASGAVTSGAAVAESKPAPAEAAEKPVASQPAGRR